MTDTDVREVVGVGSSPGGCAAALHAERHLAAPADREAAAVAA
ncbi:hypothetical protein ACFW1A_03385 [Kitasatospora sp. NPDC058965]